MAEATITVKLTQTGEGVTDEKNSEFGLDLDEACGPDIIAFAEQIKSWIVVQLSDEI